MAYEKRWKAIPPTLFTSDGNADGRISVLSTKSFKVKQRVTVVCTGQDNLFLEVKRVDSSTVMYLGPVSGSIDSRTDLTLYTVAGGSFIYADEQNRSNIPMQEIERITYEEEPTVSRRVTLVDTLGSKIDDDNPLPIKGNLSITVGGVNSPTIQNITAPTATEYTIIVPQSTKKFMIRTRNHSSFNIAYVNGATSSVYVSVGMGCFYNEDSLQLVSPLPIYVKPNKPNEIIEVLYWQ